MTSFFITAIRHGADGRSDASLKEYIIYANSMLRRIADWYVQRPYVSRPIPPLGVAISEADVWNAQLNVHMTPETALENELKSIHLCEQRIRLHTQPAEMPQEMQNLAQSAAKTIAILMELKGVRKMPRYEL